jgi:glycine/D-amino acid oxidase-like deaminating enzyme
MQHDVLIVGFGLAGWALTEALKQEGKSFVVFDVEKKSSSSVATGIYNPVVLKRFTAAYHAQQLMDFSIPYYANTANGNFQHPMSIYRVFAKSAEQNNWIEALDKPGLSRYLASDIHKYTSINIAAPHGFGEVMHTGRIDTSGLLRYNRKKLTQDNSFVQEQFDYDALKIANDGVVYKRWSARHIVFAEGVGIKYNPWFATLPIVPNKGEWIEVLCKGLELSKIVKGSVFIVPLGNDRYRVGATYSRTFESLRPTAENKVWLMNQFKKYINMPFEVLFHGAGLRPTVPDRRPIVGKHPKFPSLSCINGLGSRGVLWAPFLASLLVKHLYGNTFLPDELQIRRFLSHKK